MTISISFQIKKIRMFFRAISALGITEKPFFVDVVSDVDALNGECFVNVLKKVNSSKGEMILGWQFAEYSYMIEAELHAVWKAPDGRIIDITPSANPNATQILFVIDSGRKFSGERTDNFRFNTTSNELVDDIIEIEKRKFILENRNDVDTTGHVMFNKEDRVKWEIVICFSQLVDNMCRDNKTIRSKCFCNSGLSYELCHRNMIRELLATI